MSCNSWSCNNQAFVCYFPKNGDKPLTFCEKCYINFQQLEEQAADTKRKAELLAHLLGSDKMALFQNNNTSLFDDLCIFIEGGEQPEASDFASLLFSAIGSQGPYKSFTEPMDFGASWRGRQLVISVKDRYKGIWIGKGGKYIKAANAILESFGCFVGIY